MEAYAQELMRKVVRPKTYSPIISYGLDDIWAMDLADMSEWHASNDGYKQILVVVDTLSRYAWCKPLKTKEAKHVWDALASVIEENDGKSPNSIWVDKGTEFYNATWTKNLRALAIDRYSTFGEYKVSLAERFIRTLKSKIWFHFVRENTRKWVDVLDSIVQEYNLNKHSSIDMSPREARTREDDLLDRITQPKVGKPRFALGDWVRVSRVKSKFEKGFHPNWSYEIFQIVGIRKSEPVMYEINDYYGERVEGAFYDAELQRVEDKTFFPVEKVIKQRTLKGQKEKLVKFLGYKEPKWMPANSISDL